MSDSAIGFLIDVGNQALQRGRENISITKSTIAILALGGVSARITKVEEKMHLSDDYDLRVFCYYVLRDLREQWQELFYLACDLLHVSFSFRFRTMSTDDFFDYAEEGVRCAPLDLRQLLRQDLKKISELSSGCCYNMYDIQRKKTESEVE